MKVAKLLNKLERIKLPLQAYLSKQCGHACLSYITGVSIKKIIKELDKEYYLNIYEDLSKFLIKKGFNGDVVHTHKTDITLNDVPNNSLIRLNKPCGGGHFVIKKYGVYLDPNGEVILRYDPRKYQLTHYINYENKISIKRN